jgi:hypothetical protein
LETIARQKQKRRRYRRRSSALTRRSAHFDWHWRERPARALLAWETCSRSINQATRQPSGTFDLDQGQRFSLLIAGCLRFLIFTRCALIRTGTPSIGARPFGFSTRCISFNAPALSGKNCNPCWHRTASNAPVGADSGVAGDCRYSIAAASASGALALATSNIGCAISVATTRPLVPGRAARALQLSRGQWRCRGQLHHLGDRPRGATVLPTARIALGPKTRRRLSEPTSLYTQM